VVFDVHVFVVLAIVLAFIVLDWILGVIAGAKVSGIKLALLPRQLETFVLTYFVPLMALAILQFLSPLANVAGVQGGTTGTFYGAAALTIVKAVADMLAKIGALTASPASVPPA
jgi:hypothetical protein